MRQARSSQSPNLADFVAKRAMRTVRLPKVGFEVSPRSTFRTGPDIGATLSRTGHFYDFRTKFLHQLGIGLTERPDQKL